MLTASLSVKLNANLCDLGSSVSHKEQIVWVLTEWVRFTLRVANSARGNVLLLFYASHQFNNTKIPQPNITTFCFLKVTSEMPKKAAF